MRHLLLLFPLLAMPTRAQDLDKLAWLAGCWEMKGGPMVIQETWTKPLAGTMLGTGRTIKGDRTVFVEFARIDAKEGSIVYTARVDASKTPFKMVKLSDSEVVFENPAHDFPQRIIYRKAGEGIQARVEGMEKGKAKSEDFPYKRAACQ